MIAQTDYQKKLLLKILKNYLKLRKSHFLEINGGLKREKICDELIVIRGWIQELE